MPHSPSSLHAAPHQYAFFTSAKWARQDRAAFQASQDRKGQGGRRDKSDHKESLDLRAWPVHKAPLVRPDLPDLKANPGLRARPDRKVPSVRPDLPDLKANPGLRVNPGLKAPPVRWGRQGRKVNQARQEAF